VLGFGVFFVFFFWGFFFFVFVFFFFFFWFFLVGRRYVELWQYESAPSFYIF